MTVFTICCNTPGDRAAGRFLRPYRTRVAAALFALMAGAGSMLGLGQGLRMVADHGFVTGTSAELDRALFIRLAVTSARLTLFVVLGVPLVVAPILLFGRRLRRYARQSQDRLADVGAFVDEVLHEVRTVQAYGHEAQDRRNFAIRIDILLETALRRIRQRSGLIAAVILLSLSAIGLILWAGGHDVLAGRITPGELSAFIFYAVMEHGRLTGIGRHDELVRSNALYAHLAQLQFGRTEAAAPMPWQRPPFQGP